MKESVKIGICFGITSGIITTLGLMVGLTAGTNSRLAVIGGILTIAVADAFSDALGIHIAEESHEKKSAREIWESTISTFLAKFIFALTFIIPVLLVDLYTAIYINIAWGLLTLSILSYIIAEEEHSTKFKAIFEHVGIAIVVIISTFFVGELIAKTFV